MRTLCGTRLGQTDSARRIKAQRHDGYGSTITVEPFPSRWTVDSRRLRSRTNGRLEPRSGAEGEILDQSHQLERSVALHGVSGPVDDLVTHRGEAALELRYVLVGHEL
jgi:hypothetical protein